MSRRYWVHHSASVVVTFKGIAAKKGNENNDNRVTGIMNYGKW